MPESSHTKSDPNELGDLLARKDYVRSRVSPPLSSEDYPILSDVAQIVREFATTTTGRIFDYGCGGTPYRELFSACDEYVGADVTPGPQVDRLLADDGMTQEPDGSYDAVLSAQVLEHVRDPADYLREALRLLKPGGRILLTTHGMFHEHGCPHDYQRWTAVGLETAFRNEGYEKVCVRKITCGPRCAIQTSHYLHLLQDASRLPAPWRWIFRPVRAVYRRIAMPCLNKLAECFPDDALRAGDDPTPLYVGVAVVATKP